MNVSITITQIVSFLFSWSERPDRPDSQRVKTSSLIYRGSNTATAELAAFVKETAPECEDGWKYLAK